MPIPITMPKFGMMMTEGTVVRWLARKGDCIEKDQPLLEIETEKAVNEAVSPAGGTLADILIEEGVTVPVAETLGWILLEGESEQEIPRTTGGAALPPFPKT